jgi:outer membrane receptor for ferrienterochelin and colicin
MVRNFSIGHQGAWNLGEGNGTVALEEAENSEPPDYD